MKTLVSALRTLAPILLTACLLSGCIASTPHPSASTLLQTFSTHRTDFERLLQMFLEDKAVGRIAEDFTRPAQLDAADVLVPEARLAEYRALFDRLGLEAGIEGYGDKDIVYFIASTRGLSVSGSGKGYAYAVTPPELIVEKLDEYQSPDDRSFTAYQHIDGNWYLYYDYED